MTRETIVLILVIALIVIMNIALWSSFIGKKKTKNSARWEQINRSIQTPFAKEDSSLKELSERVDRLKQKSIGTNESDRNDPSQS
jgi:predicted negative regulator of RcsB-dependent stress response